MFKRKKLKTGFGIFYEPSKTTSGQRFFTDMYYELENQLVPAHQYPKVLLMNISAPWYEFVKARWRGQKVVLRLDGLWMDRLSQAYLQHFSFPMRLFLSLGLRYPILHDILAHVANFFVQNYTAFFRILLAHHIIYQSRYCEILHKKYFAWKKSTIVVNGSQFKISQQDRNLEKVTKKIKLAVIYSLHPSKRIYETIEFVKWLNEIKGIPAELVILGYSGKIFNPSPKDLKDLIENSKYIKTLPKFSEFEKNISNELYSSNCYICFADRDPCPNAVVESMAHGLPVIGISSGGVPDIVGDAGELVPGNDFKDGFFTAHRWEYDYHPIDFEKVYDALEKILINENEYRMRVKKRFSNQLDIKVASSLYANVLRDILASNT